MIQRLTLLATAALLCAGSAHAQDNVLNLYSARHYSTDEALYNDFTKATGIKINRVDADDAGIIARLKAEGSASPADVILLVDAARLARGEQDGLFLPIKSKLLEDTIPASLRAQPTADGATPWFGFSTRARVIVYDKMKVKPTEVDSYEKLADPQNKGKLCIRSGSHPYNLSLFGAVLEHMGPQKTEAWLKAKGRHSLKSAGSSLKFCLLAKGEADFYPRFGRTMEWDTAAGDAVLRSAGGRMTTWEGETFVYGKPGFHNVAFIARGK